MPNRTFPTLLELLDYVEHHAAEIYVRAEINGGWGSYALTELPAVQAIHWVCEFIRRGQAPYRIVTVEENLH